MVDERDALLTLAELAPCDVDAGVDHALGQHPLHAHAGELLLALHAVLGFIVFGGLQDEASKLGVFGLGVAIGAVAIKAMRLQGRIAPAALLEALETGAKYALAVGAAAATVGIVIGGFLVARSERLERIIGPCLLASAALLVLVGTGAVSGVMAVALVAVAGFGTGIAGPSRDMLIKRAAPPGATGRVYGTVYSALDLGFAVAAPMFGALLDHGWPPGLFYGAALTLVLGVSVQRTDNALGWTMVAGGAVLALIGPGLVFVRARMKAD